jgi:hypothetical protein
VPFPERPKACTTGPTDACVPSVARSSSKCFKRLLIGCACGIRHLTATQTRGWRHLHQLVCRIPRALMNSRDLPSSAGRQGLRRRGPAAMNANQNLGQHLVTVPSEDQGVNRYVLGRTRSAV